jgi:dimethylaniline monooxygenase (N-oxide forming)
VRIGIVGSGVSGLAAARVLLACGHEVVVWDAVSDLGGVWSASRRYPGIGLQNDKITYGYSDFPMPVDAPEYPDGETTRRWLEGYADKYGIRPRVRLSTRVVEADQDAAGCWTITTDGPSGIATEEVDWLIIANGIFSDPHLPEWPGRAEFVAAGGQLLAPSEVGDGKLLRDRSVLVVGWGKSALDLATAASRLAATTSVVARTLRWKVPRRMGSITFGHILMTRLGEHLLWGAARSFVGRLLRLGTRPLRWLAVRSLQRRLRKHVPLIRLGLTPKTGPTDLDSLVTAGFFEAVDAGRIVVHGHIDIAELLVINGAPAARLTSGAVVRADVIVSATGYNQSVGPLSPAVRARVVDDAGALKLFRALLPERVDRLAYVGWMHSFRSPIGAELESMWVAALIAGLMPRPAVPWQPKDVFTFWLTRQRAAENGSVQIPQNASILDLDQIIEDFGGSVPVATRLRELTQPMNPVDYAHLLPWLVARIAALAPVSRVPKPVPRSDLGTRSAEE